MKYCIWLTKINGIGPVMQKELLRIFKNPEAVFSGEPEELLKCRGLGKEKLKLIEESKKDVKLQEELKKIVNDLEKYDIKLLTYNDPLYPIKAKIISNSPILLYYRGHIRKNSMGVGVVGARRCSNYGKRVVVDVVSYLAKHDICVISGMAKGIDSYSHTTCIKEDGYTIAFLGNGLDICYPSEHNNLMDKIIENGAVISEYEPGVLPSKAHFPRRNRLISGWSQKLIVIEAGIKRGSLITADLAKEYGREVFAVPGEIYNMESAGCNNLIASGGAKMFMGLEQLLTNDYENNREGSRYKTCGDDYSDACIGMEDKILVRKKQMKSSDYIENLSGLGREILIALQDREEMTIEEICDLFKIDEVKVMEVVVLMELESRVLVRGDRVSINKN